MSGQLYLELVGHATQLGPGDVLTPQGVGDHRDVVDGTGFDDRRHDTVRHFVDDRRDLGVDPDRGLVGIRPDQKANHDETTGRL